jgi:hypothetical protein
MSLPARLRRRDLDAGVIAPLAGTGLSGGSMVAVVFISVTFPSADAHSWRPTALDGMALPSLGTKLSVEEAVRREAGRCSARSRFAGAVKWPCKTTVLRFWTLVTVF